jgi:hypothetical protein
MITVVCGQAMMACRRRTGIVSHILNIVNRWICVVTVMFTLRPLYSPERTSISAEYEAEWAGLDGYGEEKNLLPVP